MTMLSANKKLLAVARDTDAQTPFVLYDSDAIVKNCMKFKTLFKPYPIFFSVKANSTPSVLKIIKGQGVNFDVASWGEITILKSLKVPAKRIIFSAPTKLPDDIKKAYDYGIDTYAFDSKIELEKIAELAPGSKVIARLAVDNEGSEWPLIRKFGLTNEEILTLVPFAVKLGLKPLGLTFHVGSQNLKPTTCTRALERVYSVWLDLKLKGISLEVINIGGGFPVQYTKPVADVEEIATEIKTSMKKLFDKHVKLYIEPGRKIVGETAVLVTTVVNRAKRDGDEWLYLDTGVYHGLQETIEGFRYVVVPNRTSQKKHSFVLSGPSCDSVDTIMEDVELPKNIKLGDRIFFLTAGAYITSMEHYNGFHYPQTVITKIND